MSDFKYFTRDEFMCNCGCKVNKINHGLIQLLDIIRGSVRFPLKVNSGYRCHFHNTNVGGSSTSSHLKGLAADIDLPSGKDKFIFIDACIKYGVKRIGVYSTFGHIDIDDSKTMAIFRGAR